ncbi:lipocalin-like domain-containing protein [Flavilitoribacter nigricans]|uniref:Lipocalin-like domain-containing protein n=1 Tax=Flavilitoribacter nigricans (strain ATCC 23147 / DSM 23189 / NBRC 102662 / NCIMB 1420 / SS-2) TaxID=1122177 RepID=A0A2D0N555_FLAN2|nr:lipocalin family protein [Flavilitoribacter nigricans]PHN03289.1 hypothetical protein CRP01_28260 [Flavilitoribacter nigricans DSM 23189 = NBRC 102662]
MTIYTSVCCFLLALISWSCRQDFDRHLLVQTYWQLDTIRTDPQLIDGPGAMHMMEACEKDDSWQFSSNGLLRIYRGENHCRPDENFTDILGGWNISRQGDRLSIREAGGFTTTYEIRTLSREQLILHYTADEAEIILTYKSISARLLAGKDRSGE